MEITQYYKQGHDYMRESNLFTQEIVNDFIHISELPKNAKILEIGAGYGRFTRHLIEKGYNVRSTDIVPEMLIELEKVNENCGYLDIYAPFDMQYDYIIGFHVLHHLDLEKASKGLKMLLKPNGKMYFVEPNSMNIMFYIVHLFYKDIKWQDEKGILNININYLKCHFSHVYITFFGFLPSFMHFKFMLPLQRLGSRLGFYPLFKFVELGFKNDADYIAN